MTTIDPALSDCDFTVAIEDAYVIVRDGSSDPRIIKASFFSKNRVEISDRIQSSFKWNDPTGQSPFVTMIFYGAQDACKTKVGEISSGPLLMSAPRRKLSGNAVAMSSRTNKKNDNYPLDSQETSTNFNVLKRYLDSISNRLEHLSKQFIERFDHIDDALSNHSMTNNSFRDPSMNITDYAMSEMANARKDPKWRKRIKSMVWPELTEGQLEAVKRELLKGNKSASKTAIAISKIIYGDMLKTHILGEKGKLVRAPREGERALVISIDDENLFRDLFNDPTNWEVLVRGPVNQSGRERKRKRNQIEEKSNEVASGAETATQPPSDSQSKKQRLEHDSDSESTINE